MKREQSEVRWESLLDERERRMFLFDRNGNDFDLVQRFVQSICFDLGDLLDDVHSLGHTSEDGMFLVQPRRRNDRDEELGSIRGRTGIGHGEGVRTIVLQFRMKFIGEIFAPDRLSARSVAQWITWEGEEARREERRRGKIEPV